MIKLKVLALSASGKSALCAAQIVSGPFISEMTGNVKLGGEVVVGETYETTFTKVSQSIHKTEDGKEFIWLVLA